jgi:hypothetical protein
VDTKEVKYNGSDVRERVTDREVGLLLDFVQRKEARPKCRSLISA